VPPYQNKSVDESNYCLFWERKWRRMNKIYVQNSVFYVNKLVEQHEINTTICRPDKKELKSKVTACWWLGCYHNLKVLKTCNLSTSWKSVGYYVEVYMSCRKRDSEATKALLLKIRFKAVGNITLFSCISRTVVYLCSLVASVTAYTTLTCNKQTNKHL
jgi:hypothetical protein